MTGFFEANKLQPISRVTVAALDDLGVFTVDYSAADTWSRTGRRELLRGGRAAGRSNGRASGGNVPSLPGQASGRAFEVLRTKSTFFLPDLMEDPSDPVDMGA